MQLTGLLKANVQCPFPGSVLKLPLVVPVTGVVATRCPVPGLAGSPVARVPESDPVENELITPTMWPPFACPPELIPPLPAPPTLHELLHPPGAPSIVTTE